MVKLISIMRKLNFQYQRYAYWLQNRAIILAYHRIADLSTDPQLLAVSPQNFEQQLDIISNKYVPISLQQLSDNLIQKTIRHKAVVITFDDGYVDNLIYAKPLLKKYKIPATIFVITGLIGENKELWWDELERILLLPPKLPKKIILNIRNQEYSWNLMDDHGSLLNHPEWNVTLSMDIGMRFTMYKDLHKLLRPLVYDERREILEKIRLMVGVSSEGRDEYRICTNKEIKELTNDGLIAVGAHTVTHPVLSNCTTNIQKNEITQSKSSLENILHDNVNCFSYPYGGAKDIGEYAPMLVKEAGYSIATGNYTGYVTKKCNRYFLPRFLVRNWNSNIFNKKLQEWFSG